MNGWELSGIVSKFCKGLLLSQGFAATARTAAAMAPELLADADPVHRPAPQAVPAAADLSDRDLLARIQRHDKDAFYQLYLRYHRRLSGFLTGLIQSHDAAEKIIDDTFWIVWSRADSCGEMSQVSTWIIGIAYRELLKSMRSRARRQSAGLINIAEGEAAAADSVEAAADQKGFKRALVRLPRKLRLVLELAYSLGQSCSEIAQIMDCSIDSVTARMIRARRSLKSILADGYRIDRVSYQNRTRPVSMCTKSELA